MHMVQTQHTEFSSLKSQPECFRAWYVGTTKVSTAWRMPPRGFLTTKNTSNNTSTLTTRNARWYQFRRMKVCSSDPLDTIEERKTWVIGKGSLRDWPSRHLADHVPCLALLVQTIIIFLFCQNSSEEIWVTRDSDCWQSGSLATGPCWFISNGRARYLLQSSCAISKESLHLGVRPKKISLDILTYPKVS